MEKTLRLPNCEEQAVLRQVQVWLVERAELENFKQLLDAHHYLGSLKEVGQRLHYVATDGQGQWLALLVFSAPAKHLKHRDKWIGWSSAQRHRRLSGSGANFIKCMFLSGERLIDSSGQDRGPNSRSGGCFSG